jgi:hypothetical protein
MTEHTQPTPEEELQALKNRADMLKITYHPNIKSDKLREKINEKMQEQAAVDIEPTSDPVDSGLVEDTPPIGSTKAERSKSADARKRASKLVRVIVHSNDRNKKDWPGEIKSAGNTAVGFYKKYIPFGTEWHVPQIILNSMKSAKTQVFVRKVDSRGNKITTSKLIPAYTIDVLDSLSVEELNNLARAQQAAGRIGDEE